MWYREAGGMYVNGQTKMFGRKIFIDPCDTEPVKKRFNYEDVYATPYVYYKKKQEESLLYAGFYIDLDLKVSKQDDYIKVRNDALTVISIFMNDFKIPKHYIDIYFSGNKGFHIMINPVVLGITPKKTLNEDFKLLARRIKSYTLNKTIDTVVYDRVRLLRLPNTVNSKSGLYKVRITKEMLEKYTYEEMKLYASKPRPNPKHIKLKLIQEAKNKYNELIAAQRADDEAILNKGKSNRKVKKLDGILPCVAYILETGAEKGQRNNTAVALASSLFQSGGSLEEVTDVILNWNDEKLEQGNQLSEHELRLTVLSAHRQFENERVYGCNRMREMGYCLGQLCKLYKGVR